MCETNEPDPAASPPLVPPRRETFAGPEGEANLVNPVRREDPLHGVTLEVLLVTLVDELGWDALGDRVRINCFVSNPSIASSLKFLRKTPWARQKVEALYISTRQRS